MTHTPPNPQPQPVTRLLGDRGVQGVWGRLSPIQGYPLCLALRGAVRKGAWRTTVRICGYPYNSVIKGAPNLLINARLR